MNIHNQKHLYLGVSAAGTKVFQQAPSLTLNVCYKVCKFPSTLHKRKNTNREGEREYILRKRKEEAEGNKESEMRTRRRRVNAHYICLVRSYNVSLLSLHK